MKIIGCSGLKHKGAHISSLELYIMKYGEIVVSILVEPAWIRMRISPVAFTYDSMISSRVNRDNGVRQLIAPGSSHFLISALENA